MRLIIDGGSSKCSVLLIDQNNEVIQSLRLEGFNPLLQKDIIEATSKHFSSLSSLMTATPDEIIYGGAGCINKIINAQVKNGLKSTFKNSNISVCSDLEFIGKVLPISSGDIICILGTGSNSGVWDGKGIDQNTVAGGYLLGDEGSGYAIGKKLLINYLRNSFTPNTQKILDEVIPTNKEDLIATLYQSASPNKLIASHTKHFMAIDDPLKDKIIVEELQLFITNRIIPLKSSSKIIHIFGSIGYFNLLYIKPLLEEVNLVIGIAKREPLDHFQKRSRS